MTLFLVHCFGEAASLVLELHLINSAACSYMLVRVVTQLPLLPGRKLGSSLVYSAVGHNSCQEKTSYVGVYSEHRNNHYGFKFSVAVW